MGVSLNRCNSLTSIWRLDLQYGNQNFAKIMAQTHHLKEGVKKYATCTEKKIGSSNHATICGPVFLPIPFLTLPKPPWLYFPGWRQQYQLLPADPSGDRRGYSPISGGVV